MNESRSKLEAIPTDGRSAGARTNPGGAKRPASVRVDRAGGRPDASLSLTETIRVEIQEEIFSGALKPGDAINEKELSARFRTSRTPVREAMLQLAIQGLVEIRPRAGIFVAKASYKELLSMLEMIAELEGVAAAMATRRISDEDLKALARVHECSKAQVDAQSVDGYTAANTAFHELIYKAAGNHLLGDSIRNLRRRLHLYRRNVMTAPGRLRRSHEEHGEVLSAISFGDPAAAQRAMVQHISQGNHAFMDLVMSLP